MKAFFIRSPIVAYYVLTLLFSWGYWLSLLALGARVEPGSVATQFPGLMGPLIAALIVTWVVFGGAGVADLVSRAVRLPIPPLRSVLLALSPLLIGTVTFAVLWMLGQPLPSLQKFAIFPGVPSGLSVLAVFGVVLIGGFGEEVGWRGFAMQHLVGRLGRFRATLIVAGLWAVWHTPLFFLQTNMHALLGSVLLGWVFSLFCGAFVLSQLYLSCSHSILVVSVWHATFNMMTGTDAGAGTPAAVVSTIVMIWGVAVALWWWRTDCAALKSGASILAG